MCGFLIDVSRGYGGMMHLMSCVFKASEIRKLRDEYDNDFPYHCEYCEGWGGTLDVTSPEVFGYKTSFNYEADIDPCEYCVGQGKCPRCASPFYFDEDELECEYCGFVFGVTKGKPYVHVCLCEEFLGSEDVEE